jgi:hypothetical protein
MHGAPDHHAVADEAPRRGEIGWRRKSRKPQLLAVVAEVVGGMLLVLHLALCAVHKEDLRGHTHVAATGASEGEEDRYVRSPRRETKRASA